MRRRSFSSRGAKNGTLSARNGSFIADDGQCKGKRLRSTDVYYTPKQGFRGTEKVKALLELIFRHTTTLGVRIYRDLPRAKLCRSMMTVQTPYQDTTRKGMVDIKVSKFKTGEIVSTKAEFDHCIEISKETGVPLKRVAESAILAMRDLDK